MAHEVREKSLFQIAKQSANEIGYKVISAYAFLAFFVVIIVITFILTLNRQNTIQSAAYNASTRTFTDNFDGVPSSPEPFRSPDWNIAVHERGQLHHAGGWIPEMHNAQHGPGCEPPSDK